MKYEKLSESQVKLLEVLGPSILKQTWAISDNVISELSAVGINSVDAGEALLGIHPLTVPPLEKTKHQKYAKK